MVLAAPWTGYAALTLPMGFALQSEVLYIQIYIHSRIDTVISGSCRCCRRTGGSTGLYGGYMKRQQDRGLYGFVCTYKDGEVLRGPP